MRGIYTAGILESFMLNDFDPFDLYIGVSAGTCNISSYIARQFDRNYRTYVGAMSQQEFIDVGRFIKGGHLFDIDWLWEENQRHNAIDVAKAYQTLQKLRKEFLIVVTNVDTGLPEYISPKEANWMDYLKASCAIPYFYRNCCSVEGSRYLDGGLSDPLPVLEAYKRGAKNIVVLRTRDVNHKKRFGFRQFFGAFLFRKLPNIAKAVKKYPGVYMSSVALIKNPPADMRVLHIATAEPLGLSTSSQDRKALDAAYQQGKADGVKAMKELQKWAIAETELIP